MKIKIQNSSVQLVWLLSSEAGLCILECGYDIFYLLSFLINNYSTVKYFTSERHNSHSPWLDVCVLESTTVLCSTSKCTFCSTLQSTSKCTRAW